VLLRAWAWASAAPDPDQVVLCGDGRAAFRLGEARGSCALPIWLELSGMENDVNRLHDLLNLAADVVQAVKRLEKY
jgi:hypothetical protein